MGKLRYDSKFMAIKFFCETKGWSINWMCKQLEISRAAYYKWLHREILKQELENIKVAKLIKEYDERFNHILGYRRMTLWINHFNHTYVQCANDMRKLKSELEWLLNLLQMYHGQNL